MTTAEVAKALGVKPDTVRQLAHRGHIARATRGRYWTLSVMRHADHRGRLALSASKP
jgi:excisionase family DNA binding protein